MTTLSAAIQGVAVWGPGLEGWEQARAVLVGTAAYVPADSPPPPPALLPPNERRRTGPLVRLALAVAQQAVEAAGVPRDALRSVFASANGDGPVVGTILDSLTAAGAAGQRVVSPTQFHNSVHNAAAGYWSIATGNAEPANCLGCHDDTWAAGLLAAMVEVAQGNAVLLCAYDHPMPARYERHRPIIAPFGVGLVLAPPTAAPIPRLAVRYVAVPAVTDAPRLSRLQGLAFGNPAGRALRLLELLAHRAGGECRVAYGSGHLGVRVEHAAS